MNYYLFKDGVIIGEGTKEEMTKRFDNAVSNQNLYGTRFKYELKGADDMVNKNEEKTTTIYSHTIAYWWVDDEKENRELSESDIEHIQELLKEDYIEGELNQYDHETDEEIRGWWRINR